MVYYNGDHSMTFFKKDNGYYVKSTNIVDFSRYLDDYQYFHERGFIKNSWNDWNLIPCDGEYISPPLKKRTTIDIPGRNGSIDISGRITEYPLYSNRTGSFEFYFVNKDLLDVDRGFSWSEILSEILNFFDDPQILLILDDDKFFYYEGSFWVNSFKSDKMLSKIVIDYDLYPYKKAIASTIDTRYWLWDPFDFNNGYIQKTGTSIYYKTIKNGHKETIVCGDEPKIINIHISFVHNVSGNITVKCSNENHVYTSTASSYRDILLNDVKKNVNVEKEITFNFEGENADISISIYYVGGFL